MKLNQIIKLLNASTIYLDHDKLLDKDYTDVFASDLMSDALALIQDDHEQLLFLTGLCNTQSLRTAEMLDLTAIVFVRSKIPDNEVIEIAKASGISLFGVKTTMYETCGKLYQALSDND